jgi:hypothetical protein
LPVSYDDFVEYGIHRHSISPGIRELAALGFIEVMRRGRAGNAEYRRASEFRITYRPVASAAPTHEWERITSLAQAESAAASARSHAPVPVSTPVRRHGVRH